MTNVDAESKSHLLDRYRAVVVPVTNAATGARQARAKAVNQAVSKERNTLLKAIVAAERAGVIDASEATKQALLATYSSYVVTIESRHRVWPYEYMRLSRRIGELWEPFCKLCWQFNPMISYWEPPTFANVETGIRGDLQSILDDHDVSIEGRASIEQYVDRLLGFVTSGGIKLEVDLHFEVKQRRYAVDFKSGFGSNEKGNTNRLLLVAQILLSIYPECECLLLVRSAEDENNNYLQVLKRSKLWRVSAGPSAYDQIRYFTDFDLAQWLAQSVDWTNDLAEDVVADLRRDNLLKYLQW